MRKPNVLQKRVVWTIKGASVSICNGEAQKDSYTFKLWLRKLHVLGTFLKERSREVKMKEIL